MNRCFILHTAARSQTPRLFAWRLRAKPARPVTPCLGPDLLAQPGLPTRRGLQEVFGQPAIDQIAGDAAGAWQLFHIASERSPVPYPWPRQNEYLWLSMNDLSDYPVEPAVRPVLRDVIGAAFSGNAGPILDACRL